jgi:tRNA nucleotidyltransferase (CCA-adding enzyme)
MKYIKSCGFVAFRRVNSENHYLIIKSLNGDIGFPKGHTEPGESETETALRELKEETGVEVKIIPDFRQQIEYPLPHMADCIKTSVYFLGECISDTIILQEEEVAQASFLPYSEAVVMLTFDQTREILQEAEMFLAKENKNGKDI